MIDLGDFFPSAMGFILPTDTAEAVVLDARLIKNNSKYVIKYSLL